MNKQEALVALLERCRQAEEAGRSPDGVTIELLAAARHFDTLIASGYRIDDQDVRTLLTVLGGLALHLLIDEAAVLVEAPESGRSPVNGSMIVEHTRYVPVIVPRGGGMRA